MKSRTPSDSAIVAIFRDKRKPRNAARSAFPRDFIAILQRYFNDIATASAFCKLIRTMRQRRPVNRARNSAPTYAHAAVFMRDIFVRDIKPAALSLLIDSHGSLTLSPKNKRARRLPGQLRLPPNGPASGRAARRHHDWRRPR
ncbi:hypothetical protein [Paraburkholderia lacunae]|uniref:hypothetical protein n=1 Tax=Paraburkholderia lacunae TaxID=2211104 RepID=UPI0010585198|nr:hypothetical protein [Paraburkholderia lacunae]